MGKGVCMQVKVQRTVVVESCSLVSSRNRLYTSSFWSSHVPLSLRGLRREPAGEAGKRKERDERPKQ